MSTDIHLPPLLQETPCDSEIDGEKKVSSEHEGDTTESMNDGLSENRKSLNVQSSCTGQPVGLIEHDVISRGSSRRNKSSQHHHMKGSDGGWGWVIVLGGFFITLLVGGVTVSFSLLYLEFVDMFIASKAVVGWIGSLHIFMNHVLGIFIGAAITRYGSRIVCVTGSVIGLFGFALGSLSTSIVHTYLTLGVLAGSGGGMMLISSMVLVQQYFNRRRALAVSLANLGFSVGGLTFGPLTKSLLEAYAVRGTLLIIAGIYFQASVFCCLFRPVPADSSVVTDGNLKSADVAHGTEEEMVVVVSDGASSKLQRNCRHTTQQSDTENDQHPRSHTARLLSCLSQLFADLFDFSLLRRTSFQLFLFSTTCLFLSISSFLQHVPSRAAHFGVEPWLISVLPTLICSATGVSRVVFGFVANASCTSLILQFAIAATISGILQSTMFLMTTFETIALYCVLLGSINGGFLSTMPTVLVDLNGIENIVKSMAIWTLAVGSGCLLGTPFSGFLFDVTGNYDIPFAVCGCIQAVGGLCALCVYIMRRCQRPAKHLS